MQGVFFRDSLRQLAERSGVSGWARNNWDGTVEAVLEGDPEAVERVVVFARDGPEGAHVERFDLTEEDPEGLQGFAIR